MNQNSSKSCLVLSTALALLVSTVPYAKASDVIDPKEDQKLVILQHTINDLSIQPEEMVTIEKPGILWGKHTHQIPKKEYDDRKIFEQTYPGYYLQKEPPIEKEKPIIQSKESVAPVVAHEDNATLEKEKTDLLTKPKFKVGDLKRGLNSTSDDQDLTVSALMTIVKNTLNDSASQPAMAIQEEAINQEEAITQDKEVPFKP